MSDHYESPIVTVDRQSGLPELATLMREQSVGSVVVVDPEQRPLGIVTDRDLCCRAIARDAGEAPTAEQLMSSPVVTANADEPLEVLIDRMRSSGVRRLPIVREGRLVGIVSLDDVLVSLGSHLDALGESTREAVSIARARARRTRESTLSTEPGEPRFASPRARFDSTWHRLVRVLHRRGAPAAAGSGTSNLEITQGSETNQDSETTQERK